VAETRPPDGDSLEGRPAAGRAPSLLDAVIPLVALIVLIEKLVPRAAWFSRAVGVAFVLGALVVMLRPELVTPMTM